MRDEAGLTELLDALRWRWRLLLLVALPIMLGTILYTESLPSEFEGQAVVSVSPRADVSNADASDVTIGAPKYVSYITAESTIRGLAADLDEDPIEVANAVDATLAADTGDITLTVTWESPERAAAIANSFAGALVSFSTSDDLLTAGLVAPAAVPEEPSGPPRRLMEFSGIVIGLLLGMAAALLVERSRPRVRTWRDIAVLSGYPVVGRLPVSRPVRGGPGHAFSDPLVGAAVRTLRTNLEQELGTTPRGTVIVTSSSPGEGKSAVSAVFATVLARLGQRVLLVDADLHRTGLTRLASLGTRGGLSAILRGEGRLEEQLQQGWTPGLTVLTTTTDPEAGELLARHFESFLDQTRSLFDIVIVDAPPVLGADDTSTISTMADGVLLVVSVGAMAAPVSETVLALRTLRVHVWGTVANRLPRTGPGGAASYIYSAQGV